MQGIGKIGGAAGMAPAGRAARPARGGFSLGQAESAASTTATASVAAPTLGLLALQSGQDDAERDAAARRRGDKLLADLAGLQMAMLGGTADPARLHRLAALADGGEAGADPALREVLQAIALRAQVELAKRETSPGIGA